MKYIWLLGENKGETVNNNSFYFWQYIVNGDNRIDAYFVMKRSAANRAAYRAMNDAERRQVVWRNSAKHIRLYTLADMLYVSLSYRDVQPDRILVKSYQPLPTQPLVFLQHGTIGIKQIGIGAAYANNCLFRFVCYNPLAPQLLQEYNGLKPYQLYDGVYHPRYQELVRRNRRQAPHHGERILWFITWREYFGDNADTEAFSRDVEAVVCDAKLLAYLRRTQSILTLCLHRAFRRESLRRLRAHVHDSDCIRLRYAGEIDLMDEIAGNDVLVTDYSSLGFDFTLLGKPVILYQSDRQAYLAQRALYCTVEELAASSLCTVEALVEALVRKQYGISAFFRKRMPQTLDLAGVENGAYIARMFQYFEAIQHKSVAFWGYDFTGIGGTVMATRALAEGLVENGYLVRMYTLKRRHAWAFPAGVPLKPMYNRYQPRLTDNLKVAVVRSKRHLRYLRQDPAVKALQPIAGFGTTYWMKRMHAHTVVSTRESLHFFLYEAASPMIQNKIYFFHTPSNVVDELFPGCLAKLDQMNLHQLIFVTENNRVSLMEKHGFSHYGLYCVLGNGLDSSRSIARGEIRAVPQKSWYCGACLLRIAKERAQELDDLLAFAGYLKANDINDIRIDVFGEGEYTDAFLEQIKTRQVERYVCYCGASPDIAQVFREHDFSVSFSRTHSFGMVYIESILNGRMVFCMPNEGSSDVLAGLPECLFTTHAELVEKVRALPSRPIEALQAYYDRIDRRFSRAAVTQRFIVFAGLV